MTDYGPPTREDVLERWQAVARGELARETACQWAESLLDANFDADADSFLLHALEQFRQFDLVYRSHDPLKVGHGPPGEYVRTLDEIAQGLASWVANYDGYTADPEGWSAAHRADPC